uniref:uncharacterized protein LOC122600051 n=1 Tax=Erigeron canadensis TaxID=72917 RepID=UPI001CB8BB6E|nr:uncharacterized protein LOC122600051 [Erigeron canadensis]
MDSPNSVRSSKSNEEQQPRLKFLCSFNGSILPRPLDGKLRYVGGETRIVNVPKDIGYEQLMIKMKELFEDVCVLKYQQPDEDLDALVSVVNDDDVTNMMEEYEKLGSGDGFTRLRIFLFSSGDQDDNLVVHFDERDNERRYVDALNSHNDSPEFGKPGLGLDDGLLEQYYSQLSLDGNGNTGSNGYNPRNFEIPMSPVNLQNVRIPHQQSFSQRYSEMESPWSPAYYSPRHHGNDFLNSPSSSSRYHSPSDDYFRQQQQQQQHVGHQPQYDQQQSPLPENVVWLPPTQGEKAGFPGNILQGSNVGNGSNPCVECSPRTYYNETHPHERGWMMHQSSPRVEEPRLHNPPRFNDHYVVDGNGMNMNIGQSAYPDGSHVTSHYVYHDDRPRYIRHGPDFGNEMFHDQGVATSFSNAYGAENMYHAAPSHGHLPANALWRNGQSPIHGHPSYEASGVPLQENGTYNLGYVRTTMDSSPRFPVGVESPNQHQLPTEPVQFIPAPVLFMPESVEPNPDPVRFSPKPIQLTSDSAQLTPDPIQFSPEGAQSTLEPVQSTPDLPNCLIPIEPATRSDSAPALVDDIVLSNSLNTDGVNNSSSRKDGFDRENMISATVQIVGAVNSDQENAPVLKNEELAIEGLTHMPQRVRSVKIAEDAKEVKDETQEIAASSAVIDRKVNEGTAQELDVVDPSADLELDSDSETKNNTKIEPTKAEEEAISRGLQTIKNDDLEEIRELGSGTYGAVYHGKWKGSDVAIKRIKASCFAGRPSERERLIADFWKEALILSSLHHPNVVSFYGIVRDGPDGSLATVTEFMVNGSLKQFLQKKDRTIDRRKRLIIAMDASFGMEYLHGKNIVHFDLKCENLLVNMRDPHRPICKIGDLGLSKVKQHTLVSGGVRGTLPWMAPELLSGKSHMVTEKIDVYSFGIVMWELLTGDEPYGDMHCASIIGGIVNNSLRPTIPTWCDPEWKALMGSCWSADPAERPSFSEISQKLRTMAAAINVK